MFFLIRFAIKFCFWMLLISLFIPAITPLGSKTDQQGAPQPGPIEALLAAQDTISDLSGFCVRKPQACETGKAALASAGVRAGEVAKAGYQYLDSQLGKDASKPDAQNADDKVNAAHADAIANADIGQGDVIKAKLREVALREIMEAAVRQRQQANAVDDKTQTGTIGRK
jgi:hypothetical protein